MFNGMQLGVAARVIGFSIAVACLAGGRPAWAHRIHVPKGIGVGLAYGAGPPLEHASNETMGLALFGITGSGKSTLCGWLAGDADTCVVGHTKFSETKLTTFNTKDWFSMPELGKVTIVDTPGFYDTDGDDASMWIDTVNDIKRLLPRMDCVIMVVNFQEPRFTEDRLTMISRLRESFGAELWTHFAVVFNRFSWQTENNILGYSEKDLVKEANYWRSYFKQTELNRAAHGRPVWSGDAKRQIEQEIDGIPFFGVNTFPSISVDLATSRYEFANDVGLPELVRLRTWLLDKQRESGPLDLVNFRPRMGPSEVTLGQDFECLWPNPCAIMVHGIDLSDNDQVRITPWEVECGNADPSDATPPVEYVIARSGGGNNTHRLFLLGATHVSIGRFHICYCEYGKCDVLARFAQDAGVLTFDAVSCGRPTCPPHVNTMSSNPEQGALLCDSLELAELKYPDSVEFYCELGFSVSGNRTLSSFQQMCLSTGTLAPVSHGCERTQCGSPPAVTNAQPDASGVLASGDVVKYTCVSTYTLSGDPDGESEFEIACHNDGLFVLPESLSTQGCRRWEVGDWSECDMECGIGLQSRTVECSTGDAHDCDERNMPSLQRACAIYTGCSDCGVAPPMPHAIPKGEGVVEFRGKVKYKCEANYTLNGLPDGETKFERVCQVEGEGPTTALTLPQKANKGCVGWEAGPWSACDTVCGVGTQRRTIECSTGSDIDCDGESRPVNEMQCSAFDGCPECSIPDVPHTQVENKSGGSLTFNQHINYRCIRPYTMDGDPNGQDNFVLTCNSAGNLASTSLRSGAVRDLVANGCRMWGFGQWSECSTACGVGVRTRNVTCSTGTNSDCNSKKVSAEVETQCFEASGCKPRKGEHSRAPAQVVVSAALSSLLLLTALTLSGI